MTTTDDVAASTTNLCDSVSKAKITLENKGKGEGGNGIGP